MVKGGGRLVCNDAEEVPVFPFCGGRIQGGKPTLCLPLSLATSIRVIPGAKVLERAATRKRTAKQTSSIPSVLI